MNTLLSILSLLNPITFYRSFRLGAELAAIIRKREGRAPTETEYHAITREVERRLRL